MNLPQINIKDEPLKWGMLLFLTVYMVLFSWNIVLYPACAVSTTAVLGIGQVQLTTLSSITSLVGAFAGIIFGRIIDTYNLKRSITTCMIIGTLLMFVRAFTLSYMPALVVTFIGSFFIGIVQIALPKIVSTWFPPEQIGTATSFTIAGAGIGSAGGFAIGAAFDIHHALLVFASLCLVLLIYWVIAGGEGPYKHMESAEQQKHSFRSVLRSKNLWLIIVAYCLVVTASMTLNSYIINAFISKNMSPVTASIIGTTFNISIMIGSFMMTGLLFLIKRFNPLMILSVVGGGLFALLAWFLPIGSATWVCIVFGGLFMGGALGFCVARVPLIPMTGDFTMDLIGTANGFMETIKGIVCFVVPTTIAHILNTNYDGVFIFYGACCLLIVLFGALLVPELGMKGKLFQNNTNNVATEQ